MLSAKIQKWRIYTLFFTCLPYYAILTLMEDIQGHVPDLTREHVTKPGDTLRFIEKYFDGNLMILERENTERLNKLLRDLENRNSPQEKLPPHSSSPESLP